MLRAPALMFGIHVVCLKFQVDEIIIDMTINKLKKALFSLHRVMTVSPMNDYVDDNNRIDTVS